MNGDGPVVLVVDDNEDNRYTLTRRLKRRGYDNVVTAEHGQQALDLLGERPFDLVLLDIMMPVMNGYQVLETIKSDPKLRHIPVIMISALDEMDSVVRCIKLGAEDYLAKPFNPTLLHARVGACLEKKRLRDQEIAYLDRIEREKQRADRVLHAFMPAGAAQEFRATGTVRPRRFEGRCGPVLRLRRPCRILRPALAGTGERAVACPRGASRGNRARARDGEDQGGGRLLSRDGGPCCIRWPIRFSRPRDAHLPW